MLVAKHASSENRPFMMNLSAPFIAQFFKNQLMEALPYVDILFGNETEAQTFAEQVNLNSQKDLKEIALEISSLPKLNKERQRIVIITQGKHPVILVKDNKITEFPVVLLEHENIIDTNGAGKYFLRNITPIGLFSVINLFFYAQLGDAFVGGFLSQLLLKQPIDICIKCGIWAATKIIQRSGCTFEGKPDFIE